MVFLKFFWRRFFYLI